MKFFLKIALPWALSLVTAFCLGGLFFGESDDSATPSGFNDPENNKGYLKADEPSRDSVQISSGLKARPEQGILRSYRDSSDPTTRPGPPSPPSLRICEES